MTVRVVAGAAVVVHLAVVVAASDLSLAGRVVAAVVVAVLAAVTFRHGGRALERSHGAAMALGLVGLAAGIGVGVVQLVLATISVSVVTGVVSTVAGIALVGSSLRVLARRGWWARVAAVPVAYLLLQFVLLPVPVALYATHVPRAAAAAAAPSGVETVHLETTDGVVLAAWYWPSATGTAVVLRHGSGARSAKSSVVEHAEALASHGIGVLATDARGHGESQGRAMDLGWYGDRDVDAAVSWLAARPEVDPARIGAVGLSMGGEELLGAAGHDDRIRAVVAEGLTGRCAADHAAYGYVGAQAMIDRLMSAVTDATADVFTRATRPTALARSVAGLGDRQVLLIAGDDDPQEVRVATRLAAGAPGQVEVWAPADTPHTGARTQHPDAWEDRVVGFLERALS